MSRILIFIYGIIAYAIGLGGLTYFILFVGGWEFLPVHIESGEAGSPIVAVAVNIALAALFGIQHSVMARPGFKAAWTKIVPKAAERSTYVLLSGIMVLLISFFWQPIEGELWALDGAAAVILTGLYIFGWVLAVAATFVINHFELFGLQQIYYNLRNEEAVPPKFTERFLYGIVRHPLQLGVLIGLWFTPVMSFTHLFLSFIMTVYVFIGLYFEERDLVKSLGKDYENYQKRVPKIIPVPRRRPQVENLPEGVLER